MTAVGVLVRSAFADELSRGRVAEIGKGATAMVKVAVARGNNYGTAFCVHGSGIFVTNDHVVAGANSKEITLFLNPSLPTQRKVTAKVVRLDKEHDLAILRAAGVSDLPVLDFGSADELTETDEIIAFGFPFGTLLSENEIDPPAVSVNVGSVTSLLKHGSAVQRVQVDAVLNPGNSGGPLLNRRARVVGVVKAGIAGAQVNFAIPIEFVEKLVSQPIVEFNPPSVATAAAAGPVVFEARVDEILPSDSPLNVELSLQEPEGAARRFPMQPDRGVYRTTAVPLPDAGAAKPIKVVIHFSDNTFIGTMPDRTVLANGENHKLSEFHSLRLRPKAEAIMASGKTIAGPLGGLDAVDLTLGKQPIHVSLADATEMTVSAPKPPSGIRCAVIVHRGDKELVRQTATLVLMSQPVAAERPVETAPRTAEKGRRKVEVAPIDPAHLEKDRIVRPLPGAVADLVDGGNGRYLIARLAGQQQLAVFDVSAVKVVKQIPLAEEKVHIAAGAERLVIVFPESKLVHFWNLKTMRRERSVLLPENVTVNGIHQVCMGSASSGPLFIYIAPEKRTLSLDLDTLTTTEVHWTNWAPNNAYGPLEMRVSPDGSMLIGWGGGWAGSEVAFFNQGKQTGSNPNVRCGLAFALPSADNRYIFVSGGMHARSLAITDIPGLGGAYIVPATEPGYFVGLANMTGWAHVGDKLDSGQISVYNYDRRMLFSLSKLDELKAASPLRWEKRIHYYPLAGMLLTVGAEQDRFIVRRVNLVEELARSGADYLVVVSQPPMAKAGGKFSYKLAIRAKAGGVKVSLESGPDGLTVSPDGQVSWDVPARFAAPEAKVIVAIHDDTGQEVFHTFTVMIGDE